MQATFKRFVTLWLSLTLLGLAGLAAFNILVDPSGAYTKLHLAAFEPFRYLNHDRPHKAEMARRGDWEVIILGSSRPKAGLPATYPFFTTNRTCNLSMDGAKFVELQRAFDFARERNPIRHVILCVDLYMFSSDTRWMENFAEARFNPDFNRFTYYSKQLLGRASTDDSWEALRRELKHDLPAPQSQRGFYSHNIGVGNSQRELFDRVLRIMWASYKSQAVDPAQLELFRQVVRTCRDGNIDLQIAIMPTHALDLETLYAGGRWAEFEKWKGDLVTVLAQEGVEGKFNLWDFSGYSGPPTETVPPPGDTATRMKFYYENSHCTTIVGGYIMDALVDGRAAPIGNFGVRLTRDNLREHLARILTDRENYVRQNAADIEWVHRIVAETGDKSS